MLLTVHSGVMVVTHCATTVHSGVMVVTHWSVLRHNLLDTGLCVMPTLQTHQ